MLRLPQEGFQIIRQQAETNYPEEACGILLGHREEQNAQVTEVIPCRNQDAEPQRRYSIAPEDLFSAQKMARERELEIVGFYHSHPDHPAAPSASDKREAHWPECVYLICSVQAGKLAAIAAGRPQEEQCWVDEPVLIECGEGSRPA